MWELIIFKFLYTMNSNGLSSINLFGTIYSDTGVILWIIECIYADDDSYTKTSFIVLEPGPRGTKLFMAISHECW